MARTTPPREPRSAPSWSRSYELATDGPSANWNRNDNWLSDAPLGEWYGVTTDAGRVVELVLSQNQLSGELPAVLGRLTDLERLDLDHNRLSGAIPPELGNLPNLRTLLLAGNEFTGCVPAGLEAVPRSDVDDLGLPLCDAEDSAEA